MPYPFISTHNDIQLLSPEEMDNPLQVIIDFYTEDHHIATARDVLHRWQRSAFTNESWLNKMETLSTLYFQEQLMRLMEAAWLLTKQKHKNPSVIIAPNNPAGMLNARFYYNKKFRQYDEWDSLPHYLDRAEYLNPYEAFNNCFTLLHINQWRTFLKLLFDAAAYEGSIIDKTCEEARDPYIYCRCLFKLLEACHLLVARTR